MAGAALASRTPGEALGHLSHPLLPLDMNSLPFNTFPLHPLLVLTYPQFWGNWDPDGSSWGREGSRIAPHWAVIRISTERLPASRQCARQCARYYNCKYAECCEGAAWEVGCLAGESARRGLAAAVIYKVRREEGTGGLGGLVELEVWMGLSFYKHKFWESFMVWSHTCTRSHTPGTLPAVSQTFSYLTPAYPVSRHTGLLLKELALSHSWAFVFVLPLPLLPSPVLLNTFLH